MFDSNTEVGSLGEKESRLELLSSFRALLSSSTVLAASSSATSRSFSVTFWSWAGAPVARKRYGISFVTRYFFLLDPLDEGGLEKCNQPIAPIGLPRDAWEGLREHQLTWVETL